MWSYEITELPNVINGLCKHENNVGVLIKHHLLNMSAQFPKEWCPHLEVT